jgi:spore coat protein U-like protein
VNINVLAAGSCTFNSGGFISTSYDPSSPTPATGSPYLFVTCTNGTAWSLSFDQGLHADAGSTCTSPLRRAASGVSMLRYELYRDSSNTQLLGCDGSNVFTGVGTASMQESILFFRIPAGQSPSVTGTHTDTVVTTVTF